MLIILYIVILLVIGGLFKTWMSKASRRTRNIVGVVLLSVILIPMLVVAIINIPIRDGEPHTVNVVYITHYKNNKYDKYSHPDTNDPQTVTCVFGDIQTDDNDPYYGNGKFEYTERIDDETGILSKKSIWAIQGIVGDELHIRGKQVNKGDICHFVVQNYKRLGNDMRSRKIVDIYVPNYLTEYNPEYAKRWERELKMDSINSERERKIQEEMEKMKQEIVQKAIQATFGKKQNEQSAETK